MSSNYYLLSCNKLLWIKLIKLKALKVKCFFFMPISYGDGLIKVSSSYNCLPKWNIDSSLNTSVTYLIS